MPAVQEQSKFVAQTSVNSAIVLDNAIKQGALLVCTMAVDGPSVVPVISHSGVSWFKVDDSGSGLGGSYCEQWYAFNVSASAPQTINFTHAFANVFLQIVEYSGIIVTDPLKTSNGAQFFGATTLPVASGPGLTLGHLLMLSGSIDVFVASQHAISTLPSGHTTPPVGEAQVSSGSIRGMTSEKLLITATPEGGNVVLVDAGNTAWSYVMASFDVFPTVVTVTGVDVSVVPSEGGTEITFTGTFDLTKTYNVHVGAAGDATDPLCYAGQGRGATVTPTSATTLKCRLPILESGTVLSLFVVQDDEPLDFALLEDVLTVVEPTLSTAQFSMRRLFAPNRKVGPRNLTVFPAADPPKNLVVQSQDMTNSAWIPQALSVIDTEEDPFDGTLGFILHEDGTGPTSHNIAQDIQAETGIAAVAGQLYTVSMYVKAINRDFLSLGGQMGSKVFAQVFDVANGLVGSTVFDNDPMIIESRIKAVDLVTGWFRLEITIRPSESGIFTITHTIREGDNTNTFTGLDQDSVRVAFPAMDLYPLARAYRATGALPIT